MQKHTEIIRIENLDRERHKLAAPARMLREGGLVALPTETVYGLGANALREEALAAIYQAKGRPQDNPLIVHVTTLEEARALAADFPPQALALARRFWPGPLTMIVPRGGRVPAMVSAGLDTLALRMPAHPVARELIRQSGVPVAAPSANLSGSPSPTTAEHCIADLTGRVDAIVDGGSCLLGVESTVISLTGRAPVLLRPGAVTLEELQDELGQVLVDPGVVHKVDEQGPVASPGMKYRHYAPNARLTLVHGGLEAFLGELRKQQEPFALVFEEDRQALGKIPCIAYGSRYDSLEQARNLFACLRALDSAGVTQALVRAPSREGAGLAVYNRLLRAAGFAELFLED